MAVREIIRMGHPTLRAIARRLSRGELDRYEIRELVEDMVDTLHDTNGVGLAAPQVDEPVRLAIIEVPGGETRYGIIPPLPLTVFVNPVIKVMNTKTAGYWEGCLSIPGLRGWVERPQHVLVHAMDLGGKSFELELRGFLATVLQHEFDHLDGRLFVDRMRDSRKLVFEDMLEEFEAPDLRARELN